MTPLYQLRPLKYRSVWISDIHLGYRGCKAEYLLDFLHTVEMDNLYLVGDIIDLWSMQRTVYWPQSHSNVVRTILGKAKRGTKVIYIPGNHDDSVRELHQSVFGNVEIHEEYVHTTNDGRKVWMIHGDQFDGVVKCGYLLRLVGNVGYDALLYLNRHFSRLRRKLGLSYWSLATYLKQRVKNAIKHIRHFENAVAHEAGERGMDVVICGHIHHAEMRQIGKVLYCNDGDWVENCTALLERYDGTLELIHWSDRQVSLKNDLLAQQAIERAA